MPLHISDCDLRIRRPAPRFGEHTTDILAELGFDTDAIAAFGAAGVIANRPR